MSIRSAAAAAAIAACSVAATCAVGAIAHAAPAASGCKPHTTSIVGKTAAKAMKTVAANIPAACGFTVSGYFLGAGFGVDGIQLDGTTTYDSAGNVHLVYVDQGVVTDVYRLGGAEYLRLYEYGEHVGLARG